MTTATPSGAKASTMSRAGRCLSTLHLVGNAQLGHQFGERHGHVRAHARFVGPADPRFARAAPPTDNQAPRQPDTSVSFTTPINGRVLPGGLVWRTRRVRLGAEFTAAAPSASGRCAVAPVHDAVRL